MYLLASNTLRTGSYKSLVHRWFYEHEKIQCCKTSASLHGRLYLWLCWYGGDRGAQAQLRTLDLVNQKVCHNTFTVVIYSLKAKLDCGAQMGRGGEGGESEGEKQGDRVGGGE